jgi:hypothetical protein
MKRIGLTVTTYAKKRAQKSGQVNGQKYLDYYETLRDVVSDIRKNSFITSKKKKNNGKEKITAYRIMKELNIRGIETAEKHIKGLEKDIPWRGTAVARLIHYLDTGKSLNAVKRQEKKTKLKIIQFSFYITSQYKSPGK